MFNTLTFLFLALTFLPSIMLLSPLREMLEEYDVILASSSPQRKKLMEQVVSSFHMKLCYKNLFFYILSTIEI